MADPPLEGMPSTQPEGRKMDALVNQEARACYKQAYQKNWRETKFYYNEYEHARRTTQSPMKQNVLDRHLDQITSMTITSVDAISLPGVDSRTVYTMLAREGIWRFASESRADSPESSGNAEWAERWSGYTRCSFVGRDHRSYEHCELRFKECGPPNLESIERFNLEEEVPRSFQIRYMLKGMVAL
ncbi:hypothetical protein Slin14017_G129230 [Septoria linicola]|nr:hypothetical protein Slin14017_G129230 [Septoria linicola]